MSKGFVYILKSSKDEKHYTGHTSNLDKRLKRHNSGDSKATKHRRDLSIIYYEETPSIAKAIEKEKYIKDLGVAKFLAKV
ncbi:MAG: GIY-YIG nuclease family protein [Candidatus Omnitrophota bacterium]|nr:GIY-YIG nuclease family protein [Candidatus Omnitrophota bacterium]